MLSSAVSATATGIAVPTLINLGHVPAPASVTPGNSPSNASAPYTPQQVQTAYGVNLISFNGIAGNGAGQTIAIVDAYNDPNIIADTATFNTQFGLPQFNTGGPTFQVLNQNGGTTLPQNTNSTVGDWDLEESLDVQWVHSMAPKANIILFESTTANDSDMNTAEVTAAGWPGVSAVSNSWGEDEFTGETTEDPSFVTPTGHQGVTFLASAGDSGSPAGYPAYSPYVVSVGGTNLQIQTNGAYISESVWNNNNGWATGGGISTQEAIPSYQSGLHGINGASTTNRNVPDVSADADPNSGVFVYDSWNEGSGGTWWQVGGTSLSCPLWAGMIGIVNQGRALAGESTLNGYTQTLPMLYSLPSSDFNDVTTGSNGTYSAAPGYDLVTGLGTPKANLVVPALAGYGTTAPSVSAPASVNASWNTANAYSGTALPISVTDAFSAGNPDSYTLSVSHGTIALNSLTGLTVTAGANDSSTVTVSGTVASLDADLSNFGLTYQPTTNYVGSDSLVVSATDPGESLTGSATVSINVVASSPTVTTGPVVSMSENSSQTFNGVNEISVSDMGTSEQLSLSVSHGTLSLSTTTGLTVTGNGTASVTLTGSLSNLNSDLPTLSYTPTTNYTGSDTLNLSDKDTISNLTGTGSVSITVHSLVPFFSSVFTQITLQENGDLPPAAQSTGAYFALTDYGGTTENLTLSVSHGTLDFTNTTGLTIAGNNTASVNLVGSINDVNNALAYFYYYPTHNYVGTDALNFSDTDTTTDLTGTASIPITIYGFALNAPASANTAVNTSLTFSSANGNPITVTNLIPGATTESLAISVSHGTVTLGATAGLTLKSGVYGSSSYTVDGSLSSVSAALNGLTYQPNSGYSGSDTLTLSLTDDSSNSNTSTSVALTVSTSPSISAPSTATLNENASYPFNGANQISVSDSGTSEQTTLGVSHGTLSLSTTTGLTVTGNGTASVTLTGSLSNLNSDLATLSYTPTTNYTGSDALNLSDKDTVSNLTGTGSVAITVKPLAPTFSLLSTHATIPENTDLPPGVVAPSYVLNDVGGTAENLTVSVSHGTIDFTSTTGLTVTGNNTASVNLVGSLTNINNALNALYYYPTTNYIGADTLNFADTDTTDSLNASASMSITITGFSVTAPANASVTENTPLTFSSANGNQISVVDNYPGNSTDSLRLSVANGTLTLGSITGLTFTAGTNGSSSFTVDGSIGNLNAALNGITYSPTTNYAGSDSLALVLTDDLTTSSTSANVALTVNAVGAPTFTGPSTATVSENGSLVFSTGNANLISLADNGAGFNADSMTLSVNHGTLTLSTTNGLIFTAGSNGSASFTVKGTVSNLDAALAGMTYQPTTNYAGSDTLALSVTDPTDSQTGSASVAITVSALAPTITAPVSASLTENGSLAFSTANGNAISLTDANPGGDSLTLTVTHGTLTLATTSGLTFTSGSNGSATFTVSGTITNLNAALNGVVYTPTTTYVGSDTLAISLSDPGDNQSASKNVSLSVNGLPAPTITAPATASLLVNNSFVFSSNSISVADSVAGSNSDSLSLSVAHGTITLSTTSGLTFTVGGNGTASFTVTGTITNLNAALNNLTYTPTTNYTGSDSLAISLTDPGDNESAAKNVAITVNANSPPTVSTPGSATVPQNGTLVFSSGNSNPITVADAGPGSGSDSLQLTVSHGTVTLSTTAGLTITAGANGSSTITVTGSIANLNAALAGLTYKPASNYTGADSLAVAINDSVDNLSGSGSVAITVSGSAPPSITAPTSAKSAIGGTTTFSPAKGTGITINDGSAGGSTEALTVKATTGILKLASTTGITFISGSNSSASMTIQGTLANLNLALNGLMYTLQAKAATITLAYTDLATNQSATANISVTSSTILGASAPAGPSSSGPSATATSVSTLPPDSETQDAGFAAAMKVLNS